MESVGDQLSTLISMAIGGLVTGLLFDLYRLARGAIRPRRLLTDIGDLLFWFVVTLIMFVILVNDNWGQVRIYVFLGWAIGFLLYRAFLSSSVIHLVLGVSRLCSRIVDGLSRFLTLTRRVVARPFSRASRRVGLYRRRRVGPAATRTRSATARVTTRKPRNRAGFVLSRWLLTLKRILNRRRTSR